LVLAAAALHCAAQYRIGAEALERGDYAEAWLILKPMADAGDARAQNDIAIMHAFGLGVPASMEDAARWLARAAAQGNVASQARLGWMYYRGVGVEVDLERAAHWSRLAAEQGDAWAQSNYGFLLDRGEGVAQDLTAAARWYRRSAEQGFPEAQRNLGNLYEYGQGVERDLVEAYAWYGVAAAGGDGPARVMRDSVETRLAPQRLRAAQARARELFQRHGSDPSLGG
jgi:TPR repeat protein